MASVAKGADQIASAAGLGAISGPIAAIATAAAPVAVFAAVVGAAALATKAYVDTMNKQVDRLKGYSGDVAMAAATSDVRSQLSDLRRAQSIGPMLAKFETMRSRWEEKAYDLWTKVLEVLLKFFEKVEPVLERALPLADAMLATIEFIVAKLESIENGFPWGDKAAYAEAQRDADIATKNIVDAVIAIKNNTAKEGDPLLDAYYNAFEASIIPLRRGDFGPVPGVRPLLPPRVLGGES